MHVYIPLEKHPVINIHKSTANIDISKASVIKKGKDILLFATGKIVQIYLDAAEALQKYEIIPTVVSVSTIQPLDGYISILELCKSHRSIVICEEH